jgi:hypothetical protein
MGVTGYRTPAPSPRCSRCSTSLGDLRSRLFARDGHLLCERCFQSDMVAAAEQQARLRRRRGALATAVTFAAASGALLLTTALHTAAAAWAAIALLACVHVIAEVVAPRTFRSLIP